MDEVVPRVLQFDRFVLDLARGCLRLDDRELELRPKAFKVLCHLAERAGHLVAKEELHKAVWNGPDYMIVSRRLVDGVFGMHSGSNGG